MTEGVPMVAVLVKRVHVVGSAIVTGYVPFSGGNLYANGFYFKYLNLVVYK